MKKMIIRLSSLVMAIAFTLVVTGCASTDAKAQGIAGPEVSPKDASGISSHTTDD